MSKQEIKAKIKTLSGVEIPLPDSERGMQEVLTDLIMTGGHCDSEDIHLTVEDMKALLKNPRSVLLSDATTSHDVIGTLQHAMVEAIRMPIEPRMVLSSLFSVVREKGHQTQIITGVIGAVTAEEVAEGEAYPEVLLQRGDGMQTVTMGKFGLQVSFTEEALRYSAWDLIAMHIQLMRNALMRLKEERAAMYMQAHGTVLYDNLNPSGSVFGVTSGRGRDFSQNGSLNVDDLFRAYAHMDEQGFAPDLLLLHPLHYMNGSKDPLFRQMLLMHGGGPGYLQQWSGSLGNVTPWNTLGGRVSGRSLEVTPGDNVSGSSASGMSGREFDINAIPPLPSEVFPFPLRVVSSTYLPFDNDNMIGDIFLVRTGAVGIEIRDQDQQMIEWKDVDKEQTKLRMNERYSLLVMFGGLGIGVLRNVSALEHDHSGALQYSYSPANAGTAHDPSATITF